MHAARRSSLQPIALGLIASAALLRLVPHPPNFAPIGALALFSGARLKGWQAYLIPILAMLITDPILSHMAGYPAYSSATLIIYLSLLMYVLLGKTLLQKTSSIPKIAAVALTGSVQFFLVTNFIVWSGGNLYLHTAGGLVTCYLAAVPFFSYTFTSDLFYSGILFSAYAVLRSRLAPVGKDALVS